VSIKRGVPVILSWIDAHHDPVGDPRSPMPPIVRRQIGYWFGVDEKNDSVVLYNSDDPDSIAGQEGTFVVPVGLVEHVELLSRTKRSLKWRS